VTVAGYAPIDFRFVENLTGALNADDAFIFDGLGAVTGAIDDRGGNTALDVGSGALVAFVADGGIIWDSATADVNTGNVDLGTLIAAEILTFDLTGASLFAGIGASLNATLDGIIATGAVGSA